MFLLKNQMMLYLNIAICLVTYNSALFIEECIDSVSDAVGDLKFSLFIADNCSTDSTLLIINRLKNHKNFIINIISSSNNIGYAGGNNLAIREALSSDVNFSSLLILNPDIKLSKNSIYYIYNVLFSNEKFGGISPNLYSDIRLKNYSSLLGKTFDQVSHGILSVDRLHGGFMLLRFNVVQEVGYINENYFHYWEEIDYSLRIKRHGFELLQDFNIFISHDGDSFSGVFKPYRIYYLFRNQFYFAHINYRGITKAYFLLRRFYSNTCNFILFLKLGRFDLICAGLSGIHDGIMGKTGKSDNKHAVYK